VPIIKELEAHFGDQLRFVFRNFPLSEIHPHADVAAQASEFAADYDKYFDFHDLLFQNQDNLSVPLLYGLADTLKIPSKDLELALKKNLYQPKVRSDFMGGVRSGVTGTPTFFINEQRYNGPISYNDLILAIENVFVK
ncbi:MAG: DsbA family protein, partial [Parachlamydiaceae bacterium]